MTFRDRIQQFLDNRSGSKNGFLFIVIVLASIGGWLSYGYMTMGRYENKGAIKPVVYTSGLEKPIIPPPLKSEQPPPQKPQTQAPPPQQAPRQQAVKPQQKQKSKEQQCREEARWLSHYSGPLDAAWRHNSCGGKSSRDEGETAENRQQEPQRPGQVLEVPRSQQARNNGSGSVWRNDFYNRGRGEVGQYQPGHPNSLVRGSVIPVRLLDPIDTSTPGQISAVVIQDVKDSLSGQNTVIPHHAVVNGGYDTKLAYDQKKLPVAFDEIVFPNTARMPLDAFPGADQNGTPGVPIEVNNHLFRRGMTSLFLTLTGAARDMALHNGVSGDDYGMEDALQRQSTQQLDRNARQTWQRGGYQGPTGTADKGEILLIQVTRTLEFPPGDYYERERNYALSE